MKSTPFDLTGKVAVITGSSRGIGRSSAELLAKLGAKVVISSRKADACEEVADGIRKAGGDAHVIPCNISRREEVEALIAGAQSITARSTSWSATPRSIPITARCSTSRTRPLTRSWAPTSRATSGSARWRSRQMAERGNGSVVIISSIGGLRGSTVIGAYGISKAADFSLCRSLAGEWGPKGVRVNCVAPGLVKTDFARALWEDEERLKRRCATTPLAPDRRARRDRRRGRLSRLRRLELHDRPDHRGRRRRDDGVGVSSSPLPPSGRVARGGRGRGWRRNAQLNALPTPNLACRCASCVPTPAPPAAREERRLAHIDLHLQSACLAATPTTPGSNAHVLCAGHRSGHHILARHRVSRRHLHRRHPRKRNSRSIFRPPAGSSTSRRTSGPRPSPPAARR